MNIALSSYSFLAPVICASVCALVVLVAEMFASDRDRIGVAWLSLLGLLVMAAVADRAGAAPGVFGSAMALDGFGVYFTLMSCAMSALAVMMSMDYLPTTDVEAGEYYPLILFSVVGLIVMAGANDMIVMFLGLEIMSMAVYVLAGIWKRDLRSNEGALKYFLMGAFASGFLLYGIALVYAVTGSTVLGEIAATLSAGGVATGDGSILMLGVGMILVGLGFKVAAVPFHLWAPDVYEGAPTSVTAFMATTVKVAGFAALVRVFIGGFMPILPDLQPVLWLLAVATMTVGNVVALRQTSLKRMLAFSSVAHTGYLMMGLVAGTAESGAAMLFYLGAYGAMNLGAFGVMMTLARRDHGAEMVADLAGLGQTRPGLALAMTVCMLSLIGIPPLGGFAAKLSLFWHVLDAGQVSLVVIAVFNSVLSAAYYLGVVRTMYFEDGGIEGETTGPHLTVATAIAVVATIAIGLFPSPILRSAHDAMATLLLGAS